jgi:hypothetical protein
MVAGAAHEIVEPGAFAAENNDEIAGEVELVVCGRAPFIETDDPEIAALELFKGANEIHDTGDAKVLGRAGTGFDGGGAKRGGAALGEEDAVDARAIGDAKKSAEILRVFNSVKREKEPSGGFAGGIGDEQVFEGEEFLRADERDNTLMCGSFGGEGELLARPLKDADARVAALGDEAANSRIGTFVVALAGDENVIESAAAGLKSFRDRMQAVKNFHGISLERETQWAPHGDASPKSMRIQSQKKRLHKGVCGCLLPVDGWGGDGAAMLGVHLEC